MKNQHKRFQVASSYETFECELVFELFESFKWYNRRNPSEHSSDSTTSLFIRSLVLSKINSNDWRFCVCSISMHVQFDLFDFGKFCLNSVQFRVLAVTMNPDSWRYINSINCYHPYFSAKVLAFINVDLNMNKSKYAHNSLRNVIINILTRWLKCNCFSYNEHKSFADGKCHEIISIETCKLKWRYQINEETV